MKTNKNKSKSFQNINSSLPSTSDDNSISFIKLEDIFPFYEDEFYDQDQTVLSGLISNKKKVFNIRINMINKVLHELVDKWPNATSLHFYIAFLKKDMNTDELILSLEDKDFCKEVDEAVQEKRFNNGPRTRKQIKQKIIEMSKPKINNSENEYTESESSDSYENENLIIEPQIKNNEKTNKNIKKKKKISLPCPKEMTNEEWETWSLARKKSYLQKGDNPNTYLYRNLPPGEKPKNGPWSDEEKQLFLKRLKEMREEGVFEGKWGIFSMAIPGRVGYQCSNYYRKLLQNGQVKDELYKKDNNGQLHFKNRQSYQKGKNRNIEYSDNEDNNEDKPLSFYEKMSKENPLKGKNDYITGELIQVPTISPDGTVLDYNTWLKILKTNKQDPFTFKHINKRQLIILTKSNFIDFKDNIKHI